MTTTPESFTGRAVLLIAHVAGMIDLAALPVWVGAALIGQYHFSAPQAGAMVTAYLAAVVIASLVFAPRFHRIAPHRAAPLGFAIAALAFIALTRTNDWATMTALHGVAGFGAGLGLSFTHGTIGRSAAPHRLFAIVNMGIGVVAIVFLGAAQGLLPKFGGALLFMMFGGVMLLAALTSALAFPRLAQSGSSVADDVARSTQPIAASVWWAIGGITLMAVNQAMVFSFVERIGAERGYGDRVLGVLIALGFVNLVPPVLAALLERRLAAMRVGLGGALVQATLALVVAFSASFVPYALAAAVFVAVMIFTHTFVFGWLSRHDASGRAVALTPAMLMSGAALGPIAGGGLVAAFGTSSLGIAAVLVDALALACYWRAAGRSRTATPMAFKA